MVCIIIIYFFEKNKVVWKYKNKLRTSLNIRNFIANIIYWIRSIKLQRIILKIKNYWLNQQIEKIKRLREWILDKSN